MMQSKNFVKPSLFLLFIGVMFLCACSKNEKDDTIDIIGTWVKMYGPDNDIPIELTFYEDGTFQWVPTIPNDYHTPSAGEYTLSDNILGLFNDPDCPDVEEGWYNLSLDGDVLTITLIEDECDPRVPALVGEWTWYQALDRKEFFENPGNHAEEMETRLMLHLKPEYIYC